MANAQADQPHQPHNIFVNNLHGNILSSFRPDKFSGHYGDARPFIQGFIRYAQFGNLNNNQKCQALALLLSNPAPQAWYESLDDQIKTDWDDLLNAFRENYMTGPHVALQRRIASFTNPQGPKEDVGAYINRALDNMAELQYDLDTKVSLLVQGLHPNLRSYGIMALPVANMNEFKNKLMSAELAMKLAAPTSVVAAIETHKEDNQLQERIATLEANFSAMIFNDGQTEPRPLSRFQDSGPSYDRRPRTFTRAPLRCFICGSERHLFRECSFGNRSYSSRPQRPQAQFNFYGNRRPMSNFPRRDNQMSQFRQTERPRNDRPFLYNRDQFRQQDRNPQQFRAPDRGRGLPNFPRRNNDDYNRSQANVRPLLGRPLN